MSKNSIDTSFLDKAIIFAVKAHSGIERKGKGFPYVVHLLEAVEIVATITPDQELLAAAVLHDVLEDTKVTKEQLRQLFGERVATLVDAESDEEFKGIPKAVSWRPRKEIAIKRLAEASLDTKIVAMGDKLSNMRAIARDFDQKGDELWDLFRVKGRAEHEWHYRGLAASLSDLKGTYAYEEFEHLIEKVFGNK